jgi:hypothetical protein
MGLASTATTSESVVELDRVDYRWKVCVVYLCTDWDAEQRREPTCSCAHWDQRRNVEGPGVRPRSFVGPMVPLTALLMVRDSLGPLDIAFGKWNVEMSTEGGKSFAKEDKEYTSVDKHRCASHLLPPKPERVSRVQVLYMRYVHT